MANNDITSRVEHPGNDLGARVAKLEELVEAGKLGNSTSFADSLIRAFDRFGNLSEKQAMWVDKLAARATAPAPANVDIGGTKLIEFFDRASGAGLKYPKVKLSVNGEPLVISRAGARSKSPGALNVTDGGPYGDNVWYGRVNRDGTFTPGGRCTDDVRKVLRALATSPEKTAAAYGRRTGNCCFCRRDLEDYRSVSVGYGPVCADKYGLPWGEVIGNPSEYRECTADEYRAATEGA